MGKVIDAIRGDSPDIAAVMDDLKDQLLLIFLKRLGGKVSIPLDEMNDTYQDLLCLSIDENKTFHFEMRKKQ